MQTKFNVVLTSFRFSTIEDWYFDSRSSQQTSEQNFLFDLKLLSAGKVTFGDGIDDKIIGKRETEFPRSTFSK